LVTGEYPHNQITILSCSGFNIVLQHADLGGAGAQQAAEQAAVVAVPPDAALDHAGRQAAVPAVLALQVRPGAVQLRDELPVDVILRVPVVQDIPAALFAWLKG